MTQYYEIITIIVSSRNIIILNIIYRCITMCFVFRIKLNPSDCNICIILVSTYWVLNKLIII